MIVAERALEIRRGDEKPNPVLVQLFAPVRHDVDWSCRYEIDWPDRRYRRDVFGVDAFQALELAMRAVGSELYGSEPHKRDELVWLEPGNGYGFPVVSNLKDLVVGDDKGFFE